MTKKIIALVSGPLVIAAPVALTVGLLAFGATQPAQSQFINYADYIDSNVRDRVNKYYGYREFSDLPELRSAIENNQVPAGVGSDYYNVQLANAGLIQKIDFNAVFDQISVGAYKFDKAAPLAKADVRLALELLYTPETWSLLTAFDSEMRDYATGDELWEYMIPYFIQQKVLIYNPYKVTPNAGQEASLEALKSLDQTVIDAVFDNNKTYTNILTKLSTIGFKSFAVNNYMRDNLAIGSEINGVDQFSMDVTSQNYQRLVDGFGEVINTFGGTKRIIDSGFETLSAVHPSGNTELFQADVGLLYNGDALDAFIGYDQIDDVENNEYNAKIRVITPTNSTYLLDGVVIPSYVQDEALKTVNEMLKYAFYENVTNVTEAWDYDDNGDRTGINDFNMAYRNFEGVNYTTPFNAIYHDVEANYFGDLASEVLDESGNNESIPGSGAYSSRIFQLTGKANIKHLTTPIAPNLETTVQSAYEAKIRALFS